MRKFTFKGVLDGFRSSVSAAGPAAPPPYPPDIPENLRADHFNVTKSFCHGFPYQPTAMAYDPIQKLIAIGTKNGGIRILGRPGVDIHCRHNPDSSAVLHLQFLFNEGGIVSATADDTLHLWNFKETKKPEIQHALKFQRERITCIHLPFQSKWIYVGTERGNIHVVNSETFQLSGYVINWNKAIELSRKTHPGAIVYLGDNPTDTSKLLIGFDSGQIVVWDLRTKAAELRFQSTEPLLSISWHSDGKSFMASHTDGSLTTWNLRFPGKPVSVTHPHSRSTSGKPEPCKPIQKVEWKSSNTGENFVIFSGGLTADRAGRTPSLTVIHGKTTTVLEMEHNVLDFIVLCESQFESEVQDPHSIIVLLQQDLVLIDLKTAGYPCFENPYPMDIHESPVTTCVYVADCPGDLIPALYSVGSKTTKKTGFSDRDWPIDGGQWGSSSCSYAEIILTGHADGSVKFWDATSMNLQVLYKLKTSKPFERPKKSGDDPFAVQFLTLCPESRLLGVAGASCQVLLFKFRKGEHSGEIPSLEIPIFEGEDEFGQSFDFVTKATLEYFVPIRVKTGLVKKPPGYQVELVCLTPWVNGEPPAGISALSINSSYGLLAYGNEVGLVIVDFIQKVTILNMSVPDLYGTADPYQRGPKSPKRPPEGDQEKSPDQDLSPTGGVKPGVGAGGTSPRKSLPGEPPRRCRSQGVKQLSKCYSMASEDSPPPSSPILHSQGSHTSTSSLNITPPKSQIFLMSRQYYSFGSPAGPPEKLDSTFSRSRSSSMSSLDNITTEAIQTLVFADTFSKKNEYSNYSTLWVGTSIGSVLVISINLSAADRCGDPVGVVPTGTMFRLRGSMVCISFLDSNGAIITSPTTVWKDEARTKSSTKSRTSPTQMSFDASAQYAVCVSEKQAKIVALPAFQCVFKHQICENAFVVKAETTMIKDSSCLVSYLSSGHLSILSLPSLRPLVSVEFVPLSDLSFHQARTGIVDPMLSIWGQQLFVNEDTTAIAKTFCLSSHGHGLYLSSPSEIQKFTISTEFYQILDTMLGELYLNCEMPERPKEGFFTGLFGGGVRNLDREELFGEASGKAPRTVAKHISGSGSPQLDHLQMRSGTLAGEMARNRMLLEERGKNLSMLEDKTAKMANDAENFSSAAHQLMLKYKDKKWYQL